MKKKSLVFGLLTCILCLLSSACGSSSDNTTTNAVSSGNANNFTSNIPSVESAANPEPTVSLTTESKEDTRFWEYKYDRNASVKYLIYTNEIPVTYTNLSEANLSANAQIAFIYKDYRMGKSFEANIVLYDKLNNTSILDSHDTSDINTFKVNITDPNGNQSSLSGEPYGNYLRIHTEYDLERLVDALCQNGTVSFYIIDDQNPSLTYSFSVDTSNFSTEYNRSGISI